MHGCPHDAESIPFHHELVYRKQLILLQHKIALALLCLGVTEDRQLGSINVYAFVRNQYYTIDRKIYQWRKSMKEIVATPYE
jgi:hypothetical protein